MDGSGEEMRDHDGEQEGASAELSDRSKEILPGATVQEMSEEPVGQGSTRGGKLEASGEQEVEREEGETPSKKAKTVDESEETPSTTTKKVSCEE